MRKCQAPLSGYTRPLKSTLRKEERMKKDSLGFSKVDEQFVSKLKALVGRENVLTEVFDTLPYARDNCPYKWSEKFNFRPDVVLIPENADQVMDIVKLANEEKIPITPPQRGVAPG